MRITRDRILRDYNKIKVLVSKKLKKGDLDKTCNYLQLAASFMYNCNIMYADEELEKILSKIAALCTNYKEQQLNISPNICQKEDQRRLVFYDYFALDNRGLTEQYIDAFNRLGINVLFVMRKQKSEKSHEIYKKIKDNSKFSIYLTHEHEGEKLIKEIFEAFKNYKPTDLIAHTSPWDIEGLCACLAMEGLCSRYLSNITDHAFWLGTTAFDYFLEFRDYGCSISQSYRGISPEKDIKMPYFPITNKDIPFDGFPFNPDNKQIIISGGSIYKIKGSSKYLEIVKHILDNHPDTLFLYLGSGDHEYLQSFSDQNGYENRFFHIPERKDIYQLIRHSTFYLNTYPMLGGLMTQIASMAGKLPLTLNDTNDPFMSVPEFLMINDFSTQLEYNDIESLKKAIDQYLNNPTKLYHAEENIQKCVPTPESFAKMMNDVLEKHSTGLEPNIYEIDTCQFTEKYIIRLNENPSKYRKFFYSHDLNLATKFYPYYIRIIGNKLKAALR